MTRLREETIEKLVVVSDLHLGQRGLDGKHSQYSVLAQVPRPPRSLSADAARAKFARYIEEFAAGDRITVCVTGDFTDLSLASFHDALDDLAKLFAPIECVEQLVWTVGNHDHHIWSLHVNYERAIRLMQGGELPSEPSIYRITDPRGEMHTPLSEFMKQRCPTMERVKIAYPSYQCRINSPVGDNIHVYCTHGHLFGGLYTLLSDVFKDNVADLPNEEAAATVNLALIETIYWLLGQTGGGIGADGLMEHIYTDLQTGDDSRVDPYLRQIGERHLPGWANHWPHRKPVLRAFVYGVKKVIKKAVPALKAHKSDQRHEDHSKTHEGLQTWIEKLENWTPTQRTIVAYGHTHEPHPWEIPGTRTMTYNLGSWLIEPMESDEGQKYSTAQGRMLFIDGNGADFKELDVAPVER